MTATLSTPAAPDASTALPHLRDARLVPEARVRFIEPYSGVTVGEVGVVEALESAEATASESLVRVRLTARDEAVTCYARRLEAVEIPDASRCKAPSPRGYSCSLLSGHEDAEHRAHGAHDLTEEVLQAWPVEAVAEEPEPLAPVVPASSRAAALDAVEAADADTVGAAERILSAAVDAARSGDLTGAEGHASAALVVLLDALQAARDESARQAAEVERLDRLASTRYREGQAAVTAIGEVCREQAVRQGWCSEYEDAVSKAYAALPGWLEDHFRDAASRTRSYRVTVYSVEVEAVDEDAAQAAAADTVYAWSRSEILDNLGEVEVI